VHRALHRASLLLFLAPWAAAAVSVEDQDLAAAVRQLDSGDWNARMRTVHELEYMEAAGIPALSVAAVDGDWQIRMAAVHALGPLGPKATPILKKIMRNEPCPVVRLIALHNLGSQAADGAEQQAIDWMLSASGAQVNDCRDQAEPGRVAWAAPPELRAARKTRAGPSQTRRGPPPPAKAEPPESNEPVVTADVPVKAAPDAAPSAPGPAPEAPTKNERYAELDALLAETSGPKGTLGGAPPIGRHDFPPPRSQTASTTPALPRENAASPPRRMGVPETLPRPVVTAAAPERPIERSAAFEAAGSKAPHDAMPDLILALKNGDVQTRSRAADELGYSGAAAVSAVPALISALKDKNPQVRASASLALGNIGAQDAAVVPLLVKELKDRNLDVRYAATLALSRIGTPAARKAFNEHIGEDARRAIERQQPPR
jgi:HEAT repeat protein